MQVEQTVHPKILIVDDCVDNRNLLKRVLARRGYSTLEAEDGDGVTELVARQQPDLVLLDIVMPKHSGYDVCVDLKRHEETREVPIIFLSSKSAVKDKVSGLRHGAVDYLTKPFSSEEVLARIETHLKQQGRTDRLRQSKAALEEQQERFCSDLESARAMLLRLLPSTSSGSRHIDHCWRLQFCDAVGGDLLNVFELDDDHIAAYIFDVGGHGVAAAMVSASMSQILSPHSGYLTAKDGAGVERIVPPAELMARLDREYTYERFGRILTLVYLVLNVKTGEFSYSSAGHPPAALLRRGGTLELLHEGGMLLGMSAELSYREETRQLRPGDKLFFYTDGVLECQNVEGSFFGQERLLALLNQGYGLTIDKVTSSVMEACLHFEDGSAPLDDKAVLGIEFKGE